MANVLYLVFALLFFGFIFVVIYLLFRSPHRSKTNNILVAIFTTFGIWAILGAVSMAMGELFLPGGIVSLIIGVILFASAWALAKKK